MRAHVAAKFESKFNQGGVKLGKDQQRREYPPPLQLQAIANQAELKTNNAIKTQKLSLTWFSDV
jgi:hypothetical protein